MTEFTSRRACEWSQTCHAMAIRCCRRSPFLWIVGVLSSICFLFLFGVNGFAQEIHGGRKTLEFLDHAGKVKKTLPVPLLRYGGVATRENVQRPGKSGQLRVVQERKGRAAIISPSKKRAIIRETVLTFETREATDSPEPPSRRPHGEPFASGSLEVLDAEGRVLGRKSAKPGHAFGQIKMSEDDQIIFANEQCEQRCEGFLAKGEPWSQFTFLEADGKEILRYPVTDIGCSPITLGQWISRDGRYAIGGCMPPEGIPHSLVFDLKFKKVWEAPYLIDVIGKGQGGVLKIQATTGPRNSEEKQLNLGKLEWQSIE